MLGLSWRNCSKARIPIVGGFIDLARLRLRPPYAFTFELFREPLADDLSGRAELVANALGLADEGLQDNVLGALLIGEVAAPDLQRRLQLAVDAAVTLLEPRRVPGHDPRRFHARSAPKRFPPLPRRLYSVATIAATLYSIG